MRAAPAVELTVAPDPAWRLSVGGLCFCVFGAQLAWVAAPSTLDLAWRLGALGLCLPALGWLLWHELSAPAFHLRWDGRQWHWREVAAPESAGRSGALQVVVDFGGWMLLRLHPGAGPTWRVGARWLPVSRHAMPERWHALRCAVYSPAPSARHGATSPAPHER